MPGKWSQRNPLFWRCTTLFLGCSLTLPAFGFLAVSNQRTSRAARAVLPESEEGSIIVAPRDGESRPADEVVERRNSARISGARAKPGPSPGPPRDEGQEKSNKFPLAAAGAAALAALLFALWQGLSPQEGVPRDAYYVSSSSYVIQSVRDESGQLRTKVDENQGLWTNIPGLKGGQRGQRSSSSDADARLRQAQQEMLQTQAQIDDAMDQMNQEMAAAFGSANVGLYGF